VPRLGTLRLESLGLPQLPVLPPLLLRPLAVGDSGEWNWFLRLTGAEVRIAGDAMLSSGRTQLRRGETLVAAAGLVGDDTTVASALNGPCSAEILSVLRETHEDHG